MLFYNSEGQNNNLIGVIVRMRSSLAMKFVSGLEGKIGGKGFLISVVIFTKEIQSLI